jgi:hypothetical protein
MSVLELNKVDRIAKQVATANLNSTIVSSVVSSSTTDSTGHDAIKIVIVILPEAETKISGDAALNTLVQIQSELRKQGDERTPIVEYATTKDIEGAGDDT